MPPGPKRKRGDRTYSYDGSDGSQRPSPHRPGSLSLAQQSRHQNDALGQSNDGQGPGASSKGGEAIGGAGGINNRRVSRGGRGGGGGSGPVHIQNSTNTSVASGSRGSVSGRGGRSAATRGTSPTTARKLNTSANIASESSAASTANAQNLNSPSTSSSITQKNSTNATRAPPSNALPRRNEPIQPAQSQKPISKSEAKTYAYETLTDERAASWASTGKESFINAVMEAWANSKNNNSGDSSNSNDATLVLSKAFQELTRAGLDGKIAAADAGSTVKDILEEVALREREKGESEIDDTNNTMDTTSTTFTTNTLEPVSLFLDTISILTDADHSNHALKPFMLATRIPASRMREELETPILVTIGLLRDTFARMGIRKTTNMLYRQSNYNLLREETEGYSKLITEYFTTSNSGPPTGELVTETFQRILALIGAFDLDVGRVLDVTLDVFANLLVKNYRFFVKLLRASSWWPSKKSNIKSTTLAKVSGTSNIRSQAHTLEGLSLDPLPQWALPGAPGWQTTDEEREKTTELKDERDRLFWRRVQDVGIDAYFELGNNGLPMSAIISQDQTYSEGDENNRKSNDINNLQDEADREWTNKTGTLPPVGNRTAAQLLGFKLRFYTSASRDRQDNLPDNLIHLAALMIKTGFISLRDLYPHLHPSDEAMENSVKERLTNEKIERDRRNRPGAGSMNALMAAGALSDDTIPPSVSRMRKIDSNGRTAVSAKTGAASGTVTSTTAVTVGEPGGTAKSEIGDDAAANETALPEPADQKIHLLKSLLLIGALPEALFILGKFPWLMDLVPDLPDYLHRILNHALSKVYEPLRPLHDRDSIRVAKKLPVDQTGASAKGELRFNDPPPRKILRWANLDRNDSGDGIDYRFYWEDWADNIPICQSVEDVFSLCNTLLNLSGVKIGRDPDLLMKLSRIGKFSLVADSSENNLARWIGLSKRLLVPALSLTKTNPGLVNEMYGLLKFYPIRSRFNIYAEWYTGQISRMPDIKAAFDIANAETKVILKRISKTNTKPMARALAKIAYASPGVVFEVTLNQIEAYENLIEVVVECARYFTYLGYDVLTWSLMSAMGGGGRTAVESDGMMTKQWLKMLAIFAGRVFKRYSIMSPSPILQFVANQLRSGNVTGLDVLEQMINFMAGIRPDVNFNEAQIQAMAGGELLQAQTLEQLYNQRTDTKMSSKRLLKALTDPSLAVYMLIAVAQARQTAIFRKSENNAPPKVLGNSLDRIHRVFIQYLDMLRGNLPIKDFDESVPDVVSLIADFRLDANAAFAISRPSISHALAEADAALKAERQERTARASAAAAVQEEQKAQLERSDHQQDQQQIDEAAKLDQISDKPDNGIHVDASYPQVKPEKVEDGSAMAVDSVDTDMKDIAPPSPLQTNSIASATAAIAPAQIPWTPPLKSVAEKLKSALPKDFEDSMSVLFYATFWQLSLHDMLVPSSSYEDEIKRQRDKIAAVSADRTDLSAFGVKRKEARKKELNELQDRLRTELKSQIHKYSQVRLRLQKEKDRWFVKFTRDPHSDRDALHDALLQECFLPRLLFSPLDALYTFKMIFYLHASGAPGFSTVNLLDRIFREKQLTALIFYCTLQESESLGRFLSELLKELRRWHADPSVYEKMASGPKKDLPGFAERLKEDGTPESFVGYEDFRRRLLRWHKNVTGAFKTCLAEGEYMRIRNAVNVLKPLPPHYPVVEWMGNNILDLLRQYEKDPREDIKVSTMSLLGELQKRKKGWIIHAAFSTVDREKANSAVNGTDGASANTSGITAVGTSAAPTNNSSSTGISNATTNGTSNFEKQAAPSNVARTANLPNPINTSIKPTNAAAPDFQSQRKPSNSRSIKTPTTARSEFEDGEIDDVKSGESRSASIVTVGTSITATAELHKKAESGTASAQMTVNNDTAGQNSSMPAPPTKVPSSNAGIDIAMSGQPDQYRSQSTSNDTQPNIPTPPRPAEPVRTQPGQPMSGRAVHALPQKPENSPLSRHQFQERLPDKDAEASGSRQDAPAYNVQQDNSRHDRQSVDGRDASVEHHKDAGVADRLRQRNPDKNLEQRLERERRDLSWQHDRDLKDKGIERGMKPPPRDSRQNTRNMPWSNDQQDRSPLQAPHATTSSDRGRSHAAAYPPSALESISNYNNGRTPANGDRSPYMNQQKAPERQQYSKRHANPSSYPQDRILSHGDRHSSIYDSDARRGRSSRPQSPRGGAVQQTYASSGRLPEHDRRDDRHGVTDRHPQRSDHGVRQHDRYDEGDGYAPTGPRNEQRLDRSDFTNGSSGGRSARGRELFSSPIPPRPQQDPNHGRLSQDPNYGRLSSESDVPQGPRGRTVGRGNRNFSTPQTATQPSQQSSERGNHNGPPPLSSIRSRQASVGNQNEQSQSQSQPSLPLPSPASDSSDFTGIHPSRLGQFQDSQVRDSGTSQTGVAGSISPPPGSSLETPRQRPAPSQEATELPEPSVQNFRTGSNPHSSSDRRSEDKRFAGLHTVLQQGATKSPQNDHAVERGTSILGRASRQGSFQGGNVSAIHGNNRRDGQGNYYDNEPPSQSPGWQGQGQRQNIRGDRSEIRQSSDRRYGNERVTRLQNRLDRNGGKGDVDAGHGFNDDGGSPREVRRVRSEVRDHGIGRERGSSQRSESTRSRGDSIHQRDNGQIPGGGNDDGHRRGGPRSERSQPTDTLPPPRLHQRQQSYPQQQQQQQQQPNNVNWPSSRNLPPNINPGISNNTNANSPRYSRDLRSRQSLNFQEKRDERGPPPPLPPPHSLSGNRGNHTGHDNGVQGGNSGSVRDRRDRDSRDGRDGWDARDGRKRFRDGAGGAGGDNHHRSGADNKRPRRSN